MRTELGILGFIMFTLLLVASGMIQPVLSQTSEYTVRALAIIDFTGNQPAATFSNLWNDGTHTKKNPATRWTRTNCYTGVKPGAEIRYMARGPILRRPPDTYYRSTPRVWTVDAFAQIAGATETDLRRVEEYIERCYTHVDLYRIDEERQ